LAWFRKAASAVNTHYDVAAELTVALAPSIRRVRKLEERGTPANGVITGISFSLSNETVRKEFAVSVLDGSGSQRFGVRTQPNEAHRLRLGVPVVAKLDGDRGILDWDAMARAWGLEGQFLSQESIRKPPADGIVDTALDARVQRHLKKWFPTQATIVSLQRCTMLGMPTLNWDVELRLPDGRTAISTRDGVPSYAQWDAAPGAVVPAVIDPKDPGRASIDWPAFALAQFDAVGFDDDPPPGSIAVDVEGASGTRDAPTVMGANTVAPAGDPSAPVALDSTMRAWVDARNGGHMTQKDFDKALDDWSAAGMCTAAQVEAARAEVKLT
jgi:hypothetical protein